MNKVKSQFPKVLPPLTEEQKWIREDFVNYWHQVLPNRYGIVEKFNHGYPLRKMPPTTKRTLEIGSGRGEHLRYENLNSQEYTALELRAEMAAAIRADFPSVEIVIGDCQEHIEVSDNYFDRVLAIHVLEHLPNLPKALDEIKRILKPNGLFSIVIPCEGGFAYSLARNISARRIFEKRYKQSYDWFVACEHINLPHEIIGELHKKQFSIINRTFFPLLVPIINLNLCIGLTVVNEK
ncbi:class I SAM-dependent methyltransferase [Limnofasciculus baicalensis]|uniref:Class I SAM-dependent methyltransferase n=1 Tax=Limnofasciculus baicalensis BBK-W-15 TaxID=2699891 RepID=A0AAE3GSJ3_9CYAN|nr:class I SAM-dependent methyltransferase [Limnofasciculus baicalensis]MCP2727777.1 class I SAM-dependent methyltransferase [Limnofasciculus baicalensis BBK-W-15]